MLQSYGYLSLFCMEIWPQYLTSSVVFPGCITSESPKCQKNCWDLCVGHNFSPSLKIAPSEKIQSHCAKYYHDKAWQALIRFFFAMLLNFRYTCVLEFLINSYTLDDWYFKFCNSFRFCWSYYKWQNPRSLNKHYQRWQNWGLIFWHIS